MGFASAQEQSIRTYGTDSDEVGWSIVPTPDGGFAVVGETDSSTIRKPTFFLVDPEGQVVSASALGLAARTANSWG